MPQNAEWPSWELDYGADDVGHSLDDVDRDKPYHPPISFGNIPVES